LIQIIERNCGFNPGDISGNSTRLAQFTGEVNLAMDDLFGFMFPKGGKWQLDDANHTDYPIIFTDINSGQRDYSFTTDENSNYVIDIYKVMAADSSGVYRTLEMQDQQGDSASTFTDGQNTTGIPQRCELTGNGVFLDLIPDYDYTNGLKVFVNREASYFVTTDTTKRCGFAHLFHEYLALKPSYNYARNNSLPMVEQLQRDLTKMRADIKDYFGNRDKAFIKRMSPAKCNNK
jgi:hypothetical protein